MAMSLHVAMNGSLASRQGSYEQNLDGLLDGASALVRGGYSLGGMATNATTRVAKKNAKVLSDVAQGQVLTNAMHASQPAIKGALSRWLWDLHTGNASFPLGGRSDENPGESEPAQSYEALYSLEFLPPDSRYGMPPPDGLLQDMDIQLFDVHRPTNDDSASEGLPNTGSPRLAREEDSSNGAGDSVIDREISMVRIVATFASGQHGTGENASAFPGIVVRGRHCWCPSVLVSLRKIQIEVKTRCWWQMQTGLLRLALLDLPQIEFCGGEGAFVLGCCSSAVQLPKFLAAQIGSRLIERALFENFGMDNPITIPIKIWTPLGDSDDAESIAGSLAAASDRFFKGLNLW